MVNVDLVSVPDILPGDHVIRAKTDRAPHVLAGDVLVIREQSTAEPGQLVLVVIGTEAALREYEPGMDMRGLVTGLMRRLA